MTKEDDYFLFVLKTQFKIFFVARCMIIDIMKANTVVRVGSSAKAL